MTTQNYCISINDYSLSCGKLRTLIIVNVKSCFVQLWMTFIEDSHESLQVISSEILTLFVAHFHVTRCLVRLSFFPSSLTFCRSFFYFFLSFFRSFFLSFFCSFVLTLIVLFLKSSFLYLFQSFLLFSVPL